MNAKREPLNIWSRLKAFGVGVGCILFVEVFGWILVIGLSVMIITDHPKLWLPPALGLLLLPGCILSFLGWKNGTRRNQIYGVALLVLLGFILWLKLGI